MYGYYPNSNNTVRNDWYQTLTVNHLYGQDGAITSMKFDQHHDLIWSGHQTGRIQSQRPPSLELYSSFRGHHSEVYQIDSVESGVLSLSGEGISFATKGGTSPLYDSKLKGYSCMQHFKGNVTLGGDGKDLVNYDLNTFQIVNEMAGTDLGTTVMKRSRSLCCAGYDGTVYLVDPLSLEIVNSITAHSNTVCDIDVRGDFLITCGWSPRFLEPHVKVYDLRTNRQFSQVPFQAGPFKIKFHPKFQASMIVVSQGGFCQICDIHGDLASAKYFQVEGKDIITNFDVSPSGEIICFGDAGGNFIQWVENADVRVNDYSKFLEVVDPTPQMPPFVVNENTPLNWFCDEPEEGTLLSEWNPEQLFPVDQQPKKIDQAFVNTVRASGDMQLANAVNYPRNPDATRKPPPAKPKSNNTTPNSSLSRGPRVPIVIQQQLPRPPTKYRKAHSNTTGGSISETDVITHDKSSFSGLDNTHPESYMNSIIQLLYFCPAFRQVIDSHFCNEPYCVCCELVFLFHSLQIVEGKILPNSNFIRTLRQVSAAATKGFLQYGTVRNLSPYSLLLSKFYCFLLDTVQQTITGQSNGEQHSTTSTVPLVSPLEKAFSLRTQINKLCSACKSEHTFRQSTFCTILEYHQFASNNNVTNNDAPVTFTDVVNASLKKGLHSEFFCKPCNHFRNCSASASRVLQLPEILSFNTNIQTEAQLHYWLTSDTDKDVRWIPERLVLCLDHTGRLVVKQEDDPLLTPGNPANAGLIQCVYQLVNVSNQIIDANDTKSAWNDSQIHFVTHARVPRSYLYTHTDNDSSASKDGQWFLFNDFSISSESFHDVVHCTEWKVPVLLLYQAVTQVESSYTPREFTIPDEVFFQPNPLDSYRIRPVETAGAMITSLDELPGPGEYVAIDTEFIAMSAPQREMKIDGVLIDARPERLALARVSAVKFTENSHQLIIDDYIATNEPICDYKTRFSGIVPGDLDPSISKFNVVPLKQTYLKLRVLVQRGCIFVGHGLRTDFWICNLYVPPSQVRDTVDLFRLPYQRMISLRFLACHLLQSDIQSETHDSIEDAETAMKLYRLYCKLTENDELAHVLNEIYAKGRANQWKLIANNNNNN